jgi:hypothetical protein
MLAVEVRYSAESPEAMREGILARKGAAGVAESG